MEEIFEKISILADKGVIGQRTKEMSIKLIKNRYDLSHIDIPFVMHLCMSLERGYTNKQLTDNNDAMLEQLKAHQHFEKAYVELLELEKQAHVSWNECEQIYLLMHLIKLF